MRRAAAIILASVSVAGCVQDDNADPDDPVELEIATDDGTVVVVAEIADSDEERAQGLMGRETLGADEGMVFLWEDPVETSFWMKDTLIPLSIAFWNERGRIVAIRDMAPCRADPCPSFGAGQPFVGALEVNRGFFDDRGVEVGDRVLLGNV